jgi:serine/threonine-protein kinase
VSSGFDDTISAADLERADSGLTLEAGSDFAGRYDVMRLLGRGGMGAVYQVRDRALGEIVALKLLTLDSARAVERFRSEVRLARKVTHPNVARIHDFGEVGDVRYLTMEYVEGKSLEDTLEEEGKLDAERVAAIGSDIAAGLIAAHAAGIIHRDLKPANVLVAADGHAVLTDFGIARAMESSKKTHETGALLGTPHYMSPEQVSGRPANEKSDIYSFGLILYELVTGQLPFEGDTPIAVAAARLHQDPVDPRRLTTVPDALANVILACIARDPDRRPADMQKVRDALQSLGKGGRDTSSSLDSQSLFAPIATKAEHTIAVLPFAYRGSAEHDYLGDGVAEELVDVLSRTQGLKVLAMGATRRFADARDPAAIATELGADSVVDGTVQLSGSKVRIAARLIEAGSAVQRWNDRFDGSVEDIFELQESCGRRIAEALRLEVDAVSYGHSAPREAIELYLRARKLLRTDVMLRAEEALALLDRCLELAPDFPLGIVAHAICSVRAWWGTQMDVGGERKKRAEESVARALERVPDLAESHLASAMSDVQVGRFREAALELGRALAIAPTMAEAQQYLGELQVEADRYKEGRKRLELCLELDPTQAICHMELARVLLLAGDHEGHERHAEALLQTSLRGTLPVLVSQFRWALYKADSDAARELHRAIGALGTSPGEQMLNLGAVAIGEGDPETALETMRSVPNWLSNRRFTTLMGQIACEVFCAAEMKDTALECLNTAADDILIDVFWLKKCPLLAPLRTEEGFGEAEAKVKKRAAAIWRI